jgi:large subunit ribosomal protein L30
MAKTAKKEPAAKREKAASSSAPAERPRARAAAAKPAAAASAQERAGGRVKVTLIRSTIGFDRKQAAVVQGLGLRGLRHSVELADTPATRGMIHKVRHLVEVS